MLLLGSLSGDSPRLWRIRESGIANLLAGFSETAKLNPGLLGGGPLFGFWWGGSDQ